MQEEKVLIRVDNILAIELAKNLINHKNNKPIDVCFHFIWKKDKRKDHFIQKKVKEKSVELEHIARKNQITDISIKPLLTTSFQELRELMEIKE